MVYFGSFFGIGNSGNEKVLAVAVAGFFALLPDIDMVKSKLGRKLQPLSSVLAVLFRHRGFLHSILFAALVYFGTRYLFSQAIAAAAAIGYSSHLLLDMATRDGIKPFVPLSRLRLRGFVRTGSIFEQGILAAMAVLLLLRLA